MPDDQDAYEAMSREELADLIARAEDPAEVDRLQERFMDLLSLRELRMHNHATAIASVLIERYDAHGNDQCLYLSRLAGVLAAEVAENMPPVGPPHQVN